MPRVLVALTQQLRSHCSPPSFSILRAPRILGVRRFATAAPASSLPSSAPTTATSFSHASPSLQRRLALLGAPGVGKGTYARYIGPHYSLPFISTGDLVRAEIASSSLTGQRIKAATNAGQLVDDSLMLALLQVRLSQPDCQSGFLLDGFPRRVTQAQQLAALYDLDLVVNLILREDLLVRKLSARRVCGSCGRNYNVADINDGEYIMPPLLPSKPGVCDNCGGGLVQRSDDTESTVKARLRIYDEETLPLVQFYERQGKLVRFEVKKGVQDVPRLLDTIERALAHVSAAAHSGVSV